MNISKKLINSLCLFLLLACPLMASAACPPGGNAEVISEVSSYAYTWDMSTTGHHNNEKIKVCGRLGGSHGKAAFGKVVNTKAAMKALQEAETQIFNLPQCKPVGQLARTCTDLKIESTFPIAGGCSINYEFTVCAYSPFKKGILNNKSLGIQKRPRARSPRRGGGR